jgi:hypothetical protein
MDMRINWNPSVLDLPYKIAISVVIYFFNNASTETAYQKTTNASSKYVTLEQLGDNRFNYKIH